MSGPGQWQGTPSEAGYTLAYNDPPSERSSAAQFLGYLGGIQRSAAKTAAAQVNGRLGGRPPGS